MCVGSPIGRNLGLREARALARRTEGSEVIVQQPNKDYSVLRMNPADVNQARHIEDANFDANKVEFIIEGNNGVSEVIINPEADFFDIAKSKGLNTLENIQDVSTTALENIQGVANTALENVQDVANTAMSNIDKARTNVMTTITTLFENLTDKTNNYVWGGRANMDAGKGVSNVDCSGLVNQVFKDSGITIPDMTTGTLDTYIRGGKGVLRQNNDASTIKPGDIINYPPKGNPNGGHVMIAAEEPRKVNGGYMLLTFDSSPDGGTRRADSGAELGSRGAGYREIFLKTDSSGRVTGLSTQGSPNGPMKRNVTIGSIKDDVKLSK